MHGPSVDRYAGHRVGICLHGPSVYRYAGPRVGMCLHGPMGLAPSWLFFLINGCGIRIPKSAKVRDREIE